jgi:hypothetical protein
MTEPNPTPTIHFVTYHTSEPKAKYLFETGLFHGITVKNLGKTNIWNGFQDKLQAMHEFVHSVHEEHIICFFDAYDLIINSDANTFIAKFIQEHAEIVFGAEINCFPECLQEMTYPESPTSYRHLNSGFYIGYGRALRKLFSYAELKGDDQEYISRYFVANYEKESLKLDNHAKLVINMDKMPWSKLQIQNGHVLLFEAGLDISPCCLHFNGMSFMDIYKDYIREGSNFSFNYHKVYDRTFIALLGAKMLTRHSDVACKLTGKGSTYT